MVDILSKVALTTIAVSMTIVCVMIGFGNIDFFEGMTCEELEMYISDKFSGTYPLQTPFTPTQLENLNEQYNNQCITLDNL